MLEAYTRGVTQDLCWWEVADEPVVVIKAFPMKASNGVEDKTKLTISKASDGVNMYQKPC
jgi:hypothetical protein